MAQAYIESECKIRGDVVWTSLGKGGFQAFLSSIFGQKGEACKSIRSTYKTHELMDTAFCISHEYAEYNLTLLSKAQSRQMLGL